MADTACPIGAETWNSALASANTAADAAQRVIDGVPAVYALCRPPGHHAFADLAGGFCFLNNSAIAAQHLRGSFQRVVILDVDVHHGNGTQSIFYERQDVLTVSLHTNPISFYPFFWGYSSEQGENAGLGYNLNYPLLRGSKNDSYLKTLKLALKSIVEFSPEVMVIALGLDAYEGDPYEGLEITTTGFAWIAAEIAGLKLPTVLVQEGGYLSPALGDNLNSFLNGFENF
jgi:acetoin utilization deacetylase AcuC-like enzyme